MCNRHLVLCGDARLTRRDRAWRNAPTMQLQLGHGRRDVHLLVEHITTPMCANLPAVAVDLLELAAYVYTADQAVSRGGLRQFEYGSNWRRYFRFEVPVRCPEVWRQPAVAEALAETLSFVADEDYEFGFSLLRNPPPIGRYLFNQTGAGAERDFEEVLLFSGGLDSLAGAVREILQGHRKVALVSHRPVNQVYTRQCRVVAQLVGRLPRPDLRPLHVAVEVNKGKALGRDFTQRTRSFLFAAVAAVVAQLFGLSRFRFYENGIVSLNLPLSPQVLGGRASRTTHPRTLRGFERLFTALFGKSFGVENPFLWETKATVLQGVRAAGYGGLCAATCSCGHTIGQTVQHPHCGRCSQCVDRRLTALAAGLSDAEDPASGYACDVLTGPRNGPDLVLVERYVGSLLQVAEIPEPRAFVQTFPEVARALLHVSQPPEQAATRAYELYKQHTRQIHDALAQVVSRESRRIVGWAHPLNCLLSIVCGRSGRAQGPLGHTEANATDSDGLPAASRLVLDGETFEARLGNGRCFLGHTMEFALLERLNRRPGRFISIQVLREDVWHEQLTEKYTIQRTVSNLRRKLRDAGLVGLEIDGSQRNHYRLTLLP